jgi:hypothetical protein
MVSDFNECGSSTGIADATPFVSGNDGCTYRYALGSTGNGGSGSGITGALATILETHNTGHCTADINGDGLVDSTDLNTVTQEQWQYGTGFGKPDCLHLNTKKQ